jgi:hypothetical protein
VKKHQKAPKTPPFAMPLSKYRTKVQIIGSIESASPAECNCRKILKIEEHLSIRKRRFLFSPVFEPNRANTVSPPRNIRAQRTVTIGNTPEESWKLRKNPWRSLAQGLRSRFWSAVV